VRAFRPAISGPEGPHYLLFKYALDEHAGINGTNTRLNDGLEIGAEVGERTRQCECFGSDQFESPVTTSNFLRSALTSS
jgi:hypothetical protein